MGKLPFYNQYDAMDCGPTCIRMISKYYGKNISIETLRQFSDIGREGVSLLGLSMAAEKVGFRATGVSISISQLKNDINLPCILFWNQSHFVVLYKVKKRTFVIADPAKELLVISETELAKKWVTGSDNSEEKGIALLLEPTSDFNSYEDQVEKKTPWNLIFRYFIKFKKQNRQILFAILFGIVLQYIMPFLTQAIVDRGINAQDLSFIQLVLIAQFALFFTRTIIDFIRDRILLYISTNINLNLLSDFWLKLMKLPLSFFDAKLSGDIFQRVNDHHRVEQLITGSALHAVFSVFTLLTFSFVLLSFSVTIFFVFLIGTLLYLLWIKIFLKQRRVLDYRRFEILSKEYESTFQLIHGMQEIKLNNAEYLKRWEWEGIQASLFRINFKSLSLSQYQQAGAVFLNEGKNIFITYLVAVLVLKGKLSLGEMLAIQYIIGQLNGPVDQLIQFLRQVQDAKISLERINEIHQLEEEASGQFISNTIKGNNKDISLRAIKFTYQGAGNIPVLKGVNLHFGAGQTTAIVGTSGSGKTTVLKLLQKFYSTYDGDIKIGEIDMKSINPQYWRSISGSVMQDGYIFSDTIEKNIAVGDEHPQYDKLIDACKVANILTFVEELPLGFNTKIGTEGNGISAGQKQRILIARAVYKNPDFLFFDEATNALDADNEKVIMENMYQFFKNKTVIVVAHRLSTVKNADKIIVLNDGIVSEEGTHEELVSLKGRYFTLVKNQLELGN